MKKLYEVTYQITDKGTTYPEKTEEIAVVTTPEKELTKHLNKYRYAQNLSKYFTFRILSSQHIGFTK
jgi:hypothetical protein